YNHQPQVRYTLGIQYTAALTLELRLQGEAPEFFRGITKKDVSETAWQLLEAWEFSTASGATHYTPVITGEGDKVPEMAEISQAIEEGRLGYRSSDLGIKGWRSLVERFLNRDASFQELTEAVQNSRSKR